MLIIVLRKTGIVYYERDNFIPSVEDVNEREQNLDRDDFDQPDQLDASRTFE